MNKRPSVLRHVVFACAQSTGDEPAADLEVVPIDIANVDRVLEFRNESVRQQFRQFLAEDRSGIFVMHDGQAVAHGWLTASPGPGRATVNGYFPLHPGEALIHHCHVEASMRGRGIFRLIICHLTSASSLRVLIDSDRRNTPSLNAIEKSGATRLGEVTFVVWRMRLVAIWSRPRGLLR